MKNLIFAILIIVLIALGIALLSHPPTPSTSAKTSAYDSVIKTGTLRCGYALYEPLLGKDPNTGSLHGVFYDLVNEMGKELDLKIEWTTEVGYGEIEEGFQAGKYDMFCNGVIPTPKRAKFSLITVPVFYGGLLAWVRKDDHRFDGRPERLNAPNVTLTVRDGDVNAAVAQHSFPLAKTINSPQMADFTQMLVDVQSGKADAAFFEKSFGENFLAKNPGTIRSAAPDKPVAVYPVGLMLPMGETQLKNMVDTTLTKLTLNGAVRDAIERNAGPDYSYWPVSRPYEDTKP